MFSCRYRAALRVPSFQPDLATKNCTLRPALHQHCGARNLSHDAKVAAGPRPHIIVALTTLPGRRKSLLATLSSLKKQQRPPDHILVSAARSFVREGLRDLGTDLTGVDAPWASPAVHVLWCAHDNGPGTKVLCALEKAQRLAAAASRMAARMAAGDEGLGGSRSSGRPATFLALVDDDQLYKPWAFQLLALAVCDVPTPDLPLATTSHAFLPMLRVEVSSVAAWLPCCRSVPMCTRRGTRTPSTFTPSRKTGERRRPACRRTNNKVGSRLSGEVAST